MQDTVPLRSTPHPAFLWFLVLVGIAAISCASVLIRSADAPAISIAAYRVALATLIIAPHFACSHRSSLQGWTRKILLLSILSGAFLAFHFFFWIDSLKRTTVASSVTLVSTTPLFVAAFSSVWLRERPHPRLWTGILCTLLGSALVTSLDFSLSRRAFLGDLLALLGAIMAAGYLLAGRSTRPHLSLSAYTFAVYGTAAIVLLLLCILTGTPLSGFSTKTYSILILLALVPQLIGHTTFNWALKYLSATVVSVLILGEPIGATLLAWVILGETVSRSSAPGLLILAAGILLSAVSLPASGNRSGEAVSPGDEPASPSPSFSPEAGGCLRSAIAVDKVKERK